MTVGKWGEGLPSDRQKPHISWKGANCGSAGNPAIFIKEVE